MFYICESEQQLNLLAKLTKSGCYVELIPSNFEVHPYLDHGIVAAYVHPFEKDKGCIIPINHTEGLNVGISYLSQLVSDSEYVYTLDGKTFLHMLYSKNIHDISLLYSMHYYKRLDYDVNLTTIDWFYRRFPNQMVLNDIIPLSKLYERSRMIYEKVKKHIGLDLPQGFEFYNKTATNIFRFIEECGVGVHTPKFIETYNVVKPHVNLQDNTVYTQYNLYNPTSRPTNAFNHVNFAAIPKKDGYRELYKPKNDEFVQMDFDGYHVRLIAWLVGYRLSEESAHKQLAKLYFNKQTITDEEYTQAKQINFHALYGSIPPKYENLDFFVKIKQFIQDLWDDFEKKGFIEDPISKKRFTGRLPDMNPQKLVNYLMQSLETSRNITILKNTLYYLRDKKTKVVLYNYDAIVLDYSKDDGQETLNEIKKLITETNKFPVKVNSGDSLVL